MPVKQKKELSPRARQLLAMQGFTEVPDERLLAIRPWLRVAPAVTALWLLLGTITQSAPVLWILVPFVILGAVLPTHPFDVFYNHYARHVLGHPVLPENPIQRRICCALAGGWAIVTAILFQLGYPVIATATGLFATAGCGLPALMDFCLPSYFMRFFGRAAASCALPLPADDGSRTRPWWDEEIFEPGKPQTQTLYVGASKR